MVKSVGREARQIDGRNVKPVAGQNAIVYYDEPAMEWMKNGAERSAFIVTVIVI